METFGDGKAWNSKVTEKQRDVQWRERKAMRGLGKVRKTSEVKSNDLSWIRKGIKRSGRVKCISVMQ